VLKKLLIILFVAFVPLLLSANEWYVAEIHIKILSGHEEPKHRVDYKLYYGSEDLRIVEGQLAQYGPYTVIYAMHPVDEVEVPFESDNGWYVMAYDLYHGASDLKTMSEIWEGLPEVMKFALEKLDYVNDKDLILLSYCYQTQSLSIYYHPDFNTDKEFYESKLQLLKQQNI